MAEENVIEEETSVLKDANDNFQNLPRVREDTARRSLALLKDERELFSQAMKLQLAFIGWTMRGVPIIDDGLRAAIALACYAFDMLVCGWNSLIRGFYAVALHSVRNIDQATITELAVTLDASIARKFWEDELKDGDASKVLQNALKQEDQEFAEEWGKRRLQIRELFHKPMHPSRTAVSPSIFVTTDNLSASPTVGGFFVEKQCLRIGRLYADLAFKAAVDSSQAFKTVLPPDGKLRQRFDELVGWGRPLIDGWEKEMGFS